MKVFAETERFILRELLPEDEAGLFALDADPAVHRYLGNRPVRSIEEVRAVIAFIRQQYTDHGIGRWAVIEKGSGTFVGWSGLKWMTERTNGHIHYYDLGYRFLRTYWGRGIATETARAALAYGFNELGAGSIYAMADCNNTGSDSVLRKVGLQCTGTFAYDGALHYWYVIRREASAGVTLL